MRGKERGKRVVCQCATAQYLLAVLGGGIRLELLRYIAIAPRRVSDLVEATQLSQSHISHNLRVLHEHALVEPRRVKKSQWYQLSAGVRVFTVDGILSLRMTTADGCEVILRFEPQRSAA